MARHLIRRSIQSLILLVIITILAYAILVAMPGGPLAAYLEDPNVRPEDVARLERQLGIDQPVSVQYVRWLLKFVRGDWGFSYTSKLPVLKLVASRLWNTAYLMGTAMLAALIIAVPVGIISAVKQYSVIDYLATALAFFGLSMPTFWLGLLLIILFAVTWSLFPAGGMSTLGQPPSMVDYLRHLMLPCATISIVTCGIYVRYLRASMLEVLNQNYMLAARSKGLTEWRIILRHGFKNAAIPFITIVTLQLPRLFTGAVVTEAIFAWPGMGRLFWDAALARDYPVLMGVITISATLVMLSNLLADVLYSFIDPRVRYQ
ncbi:MAG: ABC transporter permease [Anaerolineales bacterium]|nr:ABC transporter permease [Anaerolineales bacterium]